MSVPILSIQLNEKTGLKEWMLSHKDHGVEASRIAEVQRAFARETSNHQIAYESGPSAIRQIMFREPETGIFACRIITYPGGLLFTGDAGTFVFERNCCDDLLLWWPGTASSYIAEKCVAGEKEVFDEGRALEILADWVEEADEGFDQALLEKINDETGMMRLEDPSEFWTLGQRLEIDDICSPMIPTWRFIWACEAIRTVAEDLRARRAADVLPSIETRSDRPYTEFCSDGRVLAAALDDGTIALPYDDGPRNLSKKAAIALAHSLILAVHTSPVAVAS